MTSPSVQRLEQALRLVPAIPEFPLLLVLLLSACSATDPNDTASCQADGEQRCSDDGTAVEQCDGGEWATWQDCDSECHTNEGVADCDEPASG